MNFPDHPVLQRCDPVTYTQERDRDESATLRFSFAVPALMRLIALAILIALLVLVPALEPVWAADLHSTGHSYCPVHANPGILAEGDLVLPLPCAQMLRGAGGSIHLLDRIRTHFVPPRP